MAQMGFFDLSDCYASLDAKKDPLVEIDTVVSWEEFRPVLVIYPDRTGQIIGLKRNDAHRWLYMSEMTPDEAVIFLTFDSSGRAPVGHSAADLVETPENAIPRCSIETRALVRFGYPLDVA